MKYTDWLTKPQAAAALNRSEKAVERLAKQGRLQQAARDGRSVYHPGDVRKIVQDRDEKRDDPFLLPVHPGGDYEGLPDTSLEPAPALMPEAVERLIALLTPVKAIEDGAYIPIARAVGLSGLSKQTIKNLVKQKKIATMPFGGGVRYRRADVLAL